MSSRVLVGNTILKNSKILNYAKLEQNMVFAFLYSRGLIQNSGIKYSRKIRN